jgi:hypothetical protein
MMRESHINEVVHFFSPSQQRLLQGTLRITELRIRSYHTNTTNVSNISNPLTLNLILSGMLALSRNPISSKGVTASQLQSWNNGILPSGFMRGNNNETGTTIPKAYINYHYCPTKIGINSSTTLYSKGLHQKNTVFLFQG